MSKKMIIDNCSECISIFKEPCDVYRGRKDSNIPIDCPLPDDTSEADKAEIKRLNEEIYSLKEQLKMRY